MRALAFQRSSPVFAFSASTCFNNFTVRSACPSNRGVPFVTLLNVSDSNFRRLCVACWTLEKRCLPPVSLPRTALWFCRPLLSFPPSRTALSFTRAFRLFRLLGLSLGDLSLGFEFRPRSIFGFEFRLRSPHFRLREFRLRIVSSLPFSASPPFSASQISASNFVFAPIFGFEFRLRSPHFRLREFRLRIVSSLPFSASPPSSASQISASNFVFAPIFGAPFSASTICRSEFRLRNCVFALPLKSGPPQPCQCLEQYEDHHNETPCLPIKTDEVIRPEEPA